MDTATRDIALLLALKPFLRPRARQLVDTLVQTAAKQAEFQSSGPIDTVQLLTLTQQEIAVETDRLTTLALLWIPLWLSSGDSPRTPLGAADATQLLDSNFLTLFALTLAIANALP
ncbi:MAG: hypothetical protein ACPLPR_01985 [Bacillota bacterium]